MIANRRAMYIVERNALAYRRMWYVFVAGFAEPVLYLLSVGVGVGHLVGRLPGPGGRLVPYQTFVAPGMMAAAAIEPDVAAALAEGQRRHRAGMSRLVGRLAAAGALKPGLAPERAGDILGLLAWAATFRQLTEDYGWTLDAAEAWITETAVTLLLAEPG